MKLRLVPIAVLVATVVAGSATAQDLARRPALRIVRVEPTVAVQGAHFRHGEKVRVVFSFSSVRRTRWVRASATGSFTASLGSLPAAFDRCTDVFGVVAVGGSGDEANVKYVPRECPPAP